MRKSLVFIATSFSFLCSGYAVAQNSDISQFAQPSPIYTSLEHSNFLKKPLDSEERRAAARGLPKQKMVHHKNKDKDVYMYSDPDNCNCLYMGDSNAYQNLSSQPTLRDRSTGDMAAEEINHEASQNWNWGTWGDSMAPGNGLGPGN